MKTRPATMLVEHAGSGFLMPEETARRIENLSRGLPADFTYRRRSAPAAELELNPGERTDVSTITTDALDRDRECVLPGGGDWSAYNRVVPFAHDYRQLPAGSCWWIKPKGARDKLGPSGLIAKTHYPAKPADWGDAPWLPSAVLHLMQQPVPTCTGKSIGFLPLNIREATKEELARRPELAGVPMIDRWAGIEYSVVPVPCNPEAEMLAVAKGVEAGVFDAGVADLITKAMAPFLVGWHSPINAADSVKDETLLLADSLTMADTDRAVVSPGDAPVPPTTPGAPDAAAEAASKAEAVERAASAAFVRPETIRAALRRAVEDARAELPVMIRHELREAYARATGKV